MAIPSSSLGRCRFRDEMRPSRAMMIVAFLLAIAGASSAQAATPRCSDVTGLDSLVAEARLHNLMLGEVHGSEEVPTVTGCLVDAMLITHRGRLIVAVELPPSARYVNSRVWRGADGRTSKAMFELTRRLIALEAEGALEIFWLRKEVGGLVAWEPKFVADELAALARRGRVIALTGNAYPRKRLPEGAGAMTVPGMYLDASFRSVSFIALLESQVYNCMASCGVNDVHGAAKCYHEGLQQPCDSSAATIGFDWAFALSKLSPSAPAPPQ